jgi:membrane protease YdiL (CAAX protease family)
MQTVPGPGWYSDPWQTAPRRWWDGQQWTGYTQGPMQPPVAVTPALPHARDDVQGGGIAIFGFIAAMAMSACGNGFAVYVLGAPKTSVTAMVGAVVGLWTGIACTAYIVTRRREGGTFADLGFAWPTGSEFGMGLGLAFLAALAAGQVATLLHNLLPQDDTNIKSNLFLAHPLSTAAILTIVAAVCIGAPIFEELFFRGIVQGVLSRRMTAGAAIVVQAGLFGCVHYQLGMSANEAIVRIGSIMVVGLFLGWLRHRTGRLGAGMVLHGTYNLIVVLVTIAALSST